MSIPDKIMGLDNLAHLSPEACGFVVKDYHQTLSRLRSERATPYSISFINPNRVDKQVFTLDADLDWYGIVPPHDIRSIYLASSAFYNPTGYPLPEDFGQYSEEELFQFVLSALGQTLYELSDLDEMAKECGDEDFEEEDVSPNEVTETHHLEGIACALFSHLRSKGYLGHDLVIVYAGDLEQQDMHPVSLGYVDLMSIVE